MWAVDNCSSANNPGTTLNAARTQFEQAIEMGQIDCSNGMEDACKQIRQRLACYSAAESVAWNHVSIAGIPAKLPDNSSVEDVVTAWMKTAEKENVRTLGEVAEFAKQVLGVVELHQELASAYNSCS